MKLEDILNRGVQFTGKAQTSRGGWGYVANGCNMEGDIPPQLNQDGKALVAYLQRLGTSIGDWREDFVSTRVSVGEIEDQLIAQTFFSQALPPDQSRQQVRAFIDWVRRLGILRLEAGYGDRDFHYDIRMLLNKSSAPRN